MEDPCSYFIGQEVNYINVIFVKNESIVNEQNNRKSTILQVLFQNLNCFYAYYLGRNVVCLNMENIVFTYNYLYFIFYNAHAC